MIDSSKDGGASDKIEEDSEENEWSRRGVLSVGGGLLAGGIGGIAVSPSLRGAVSDLRDDLVLSDQPISTVLVSSSELTIRLAERAGVDELNVIDSGGWAVESFAPKMTDTADFAVSRTRLDSGEYRIVAARAGEIVQERTVTID